MPVTDSSPERPADARRRTPNRALHSAIIPANTLYGALLYVQLGCVAPNDSHWTQDFPTTQQRALLCRVAILRAGSLVDMSVNRTIGDTGGPPTERTRLRRFNWLAKYDREKINAIIDAGIVCQVGYVIDGMPYVTPTNPLAY
jgi:hypothetical protein